MDNSRLWADIDTYDRLDLASYTGRKGRRWTYTHDADRRLTTIARYGIQVNVDSKVAQTGGASKY